MMAGKGLGGLLSSGIFGSSSSSSSSAQPEQEAVEAKEENESESIGWNFGGFIKTLAEKSGGVLQVYQHDLQEFGIGLKKETAAVARLPLSLESTASVAQESLESVGQVVEDFGSSVWRGTTEIFAQVKEAVLSIDEEAPAATPSDPLTAQLSGGKYSRYEAQVRAMQRDSSTYCDEPKDLDEYEAWIHSFRIDDRKDEIEELLSSNAFMQELQNRIVPLVVEYDVFWTRYFFHLHKLQQVENARANLVKRATAGEEEEDLSWDVEEDKEEEEAKDKQEVTEPKEVPESETESTSETTTTTVEEPESKASLSTASIDLSAAPVAEDAHDEEEAKSEGSTGSEWLVVPEEKVLESTEPVNSSIPSSSMQFERNEGQVGDRVGGDDTELDNIPDLSIDDESQDPVLPDSDKTSKPTGPTVSHGDETEEDWGEWE
ncbi:unnamed protein product [Sphagnum balticum]